MIKPGGKGAGGQGEDSFFAFQEDFSFIAHFLRRSPFDRNVFNKVRRLFLEEGENGYINKLLIHLFMSSRPEVQAAPPPPPPLLFTHRLCL